MRIFWATKQIPELAALSPSERAASWRRVYRKTYRHWQTWLSLLSCPAFTALGSYVDNLLGTSYGAMLIGAALGGLLFGETTIYVARRYYKAELSQPHQDR
ncbi:hypothetical protein [Herbaspirillum rubrisubalbicans]|uniref:hypothetical protein n=1 Tax=Herbaspirillum rubrisubalbicans TaxID=80842 RepID=UPI0015C56DF7|nr:hypothetical protein [Herbaspirillum rubrisubalbicans]NQE49325.1 hypothetical protein [Herbaspirillum rubrisubalbicans]